MTPGGAPEQAPRHALGRTGIDVPHVGIGCAWLGRRGADFDEEIAFDTICTALDSGIRLVDTASIYLGGASERLVGDALRARPTIAREVVVQTKVRDRRDFAYSYDETLRSVETSLTRLGLARLPLVFIHDPPAALLATVVAPGGALMALRSLQAQGVVGHIGVASNNPSDNAPYVETGEFEMAVVPDAYSLLSQVALERIFPAAERFGMGVVVATPLERGLLATGLAGLEDATHHARRFSPECLRQVGLIEEVCRRHGVSLLAAALQYVTRHPVVAATVPGARTPAEARANALAAREAIPEAFWTELQPLIMDWDIAIPN